MEKCTERVSASGVMAPCTQVLGETAQSMARVCSSMAMDPNTKDLSKTTFRRVEA